MQYAEITWGFHTTSPPMFLYLWIKFIVDLFVETLWCKSYKENLISCGDIGHKLIL